MSQTSIILNVVQQKLEDILETQNVIVNNQQEMIYKLKDIEHRLVSVESHIFRQSQQQLPSTSMGQGLLHSQLSSQRMSFMPRMQTKRLPHKRGSDNPNEGEELEQRDTDMEKRSGKRVKPESPSDDIEEGEINVGDENMQKNPSEPGASSRADEDLEEESECDDDDDQSTESSSTVNLNFSQKSSKSTPPMQSLPRSSMPHSILQTLTASSLLSSLQSLHQQQQTNDLTLLATEESTGRVMLEDAEIRRIYATSKSRGNFSALLVQKMYTKDERVVSNVMGTRGKRQLSPHRMTVVRRLSFAMYPVNDDREEEMVWKKECVKAIDSKNRKVRTHHGVKSEPSSSAPPGGLPSTPSSSSLSGLNRTGLMTPNSRVIGSQRPFGLSLNTLSQNQAHNTTPSSSANALAFAMAAAAAAAVASNQGNRSPKVESKYPTDYSNS